MLANFTLVLHPGLKLEYFRQHQWDEEWIDVAENLVREEYMVNYEKHPTVSENDSTEMRSDKVSVSQSGFAALTDEQYRKMRTTSLILLTYQSAPYSYLRPANSTHI